MADATTSLLAQTKPLFGETDGVVKKAIKRGSSGRRRPRRALLPARVDGPMRCDSGVAVISEHRRTMLIHTSWNELLATPLERHHVGHVL